MSPDSLLTIRIKHRVGVMSLDVNFELTEPWTVLFGPSGSGKTTILRTIAGFIRADSGRIAMQDRVLVDSATGAFVPPHQRPMRSAAQAARLFPHRTLRWNLMYGNGWTSKPADAMEIVEESLRLFRLTALADRMPGELSGGERQRGSVARAVVSAATYAGPAKPLLLIDEPFSGLDNTVRDELLPELQAQLRGWKIPVLSVTHDVGETFQLGADVLKLAEGRIVQQGPVAEVLSEERLRLIEQLGLERFNTEFNTEQLDTAQFNPSNRSPT
jgi:molybdate transport system ATP-binding protein